MIVSHGEIHWQPYRKIINYAHWRRSRSRIASCSQKPLKRRVDITTIKCAAAPSTNRGVGKWLIIISIIERAARGGGKSRSSRRRRRRRSTGSLTRYYCQCNMLRCPIKRRPISVAASATNKRIYGFAVAYRAAFS